MNTMPLLRPTASDFTATVKAVAQYVAPGATAKPSRSGGGMLVAPPSLGAIARASQVGALMSPTTSAVNIAGVTQPPPSGGVPRTPVATIFTYTGADQVYTVPAGVTSLTLHMWGAGGANSGGTGGGAGAYINGTLAVTPASSLTIIVGGGGNLGTGSTAGVGGFGGGGNGGMYGPGGGGRSAIRLSSTELVTAGGGGACGGNATYGGCANFSPTLAIGTNPAGAGAQGLGTFSQPLNGMGGTQTAGGAASSTAQFGGTATAGTSLQGGAGATYGAGGGGGYYGGAGAGVLSTAAASGGGGSSYTTNANFTLISGSNAPGAPTVLSGAPATSSPYYVSGVAVGAGSQSNGGNGLVVIFA
jgi:hypothetical protein